jgi:hypothetical protein
MTDFGSVVQMSAGSDVPGCGRLCSSDSRHPTADVGSQSHNRLMNLIEELRFAIFCCRGAVMRFHFASFHRILQDDRGVAALEFAIIAPVMITMFFGVVELSNVMRAQAKLNIAAGQFVEMIAAQSSVTERSSEGPGGTLGDYCTAASYNMLPFPTANLSAWVESTTVTQGFGVQLGQDWANDTSCPSTNKAGSFAETITLTAIANTPQSLFTADGTPWGSGGTLVVGYTAISAKLTYQYSNVLTHFLGSTVTLTAVAAARPRANVAVKCTYLSGTSNQPCPGVY